jgi:hypothetical protein
MRKVILFLLLLIGATAVYCQTPSNNPWHVGMITVPTANTTAISATASSNAIFLDRVVLVNVTASPVTVTITDGGTNCNGGVCQILSAVPIAANTTYVIDLGGLRGWSSFKWTAGTANAIHGWLAGRY